MKSLALLAVVVGLAGCTQQQMQQTGIDNAYAQLDVCTKDVIARPEFAALTPHTHSGREIPASELADGRLPTPEEARLVMARWDAGAPCRQTFLAAIAANAPDAAPIMSALYAQVSMNTVHFVKGDMTWGQLAQARQAINVAWHAQLSAADAEHNRQAANRALAAAAIFGHMRNQTQDFYDQQMRAYSRPAYQNPNINCTSNVMGNIVSTNCY